MPRRSHTRAVACDRAWPPAAASGKKTGDLNRRAACSARLARTRAKPRSGVALDTEAQPAMQSERGARAALFRPDHAALDPTRAPRPTGWSPASAPVERGV
jgi:hypothetical protein